MLSPKLIAAIITIGMVLSTASSADMYKWVDGEGHVHYGDKPPRGAENEALHSPPPVDRDEAARRRERLEKMEKEMDVRMEDRRAKAAAKEVEKLEQASVRERCLALRRELETFNFGIPVYRNEQGRLRHSWCNDHYQGKRFYLDNDEWSREIAQLREDISTHCGDPDDPKARRLARAQFAKPARCGGDLSPVIRSK